MVHNSLIKPLALLKDKLAFETAAESYEKAFAPSGPNLFKDLAYCSTLIPLFLISALNVLKFNKPVSLSVEVDKIDFNFVT
ncbi:MAG: hypothetical protein ACI4W0_01175 [Bacilli bacterium]